MAVDEALLEAAVAGGDATLRLYQWNQPTLSLGYFQHYNDRNQHIASRECAIVRRQSGGGAILHDRELTYSLSLPPRHPLSRNATALYNAVHNLFIAVLAPRLGPKASEQFRLALNEVDSKLRPNEEPFLCFQRRARGDLLLESKKNTATNSAPQTYKVLGSAQRRHRGAILQHGSFLVSRSSAAPELAGWQDLTGVQFVLDELMADWVRQFCHLSSANMQPEELPESIRSAAREIERNKYSSRSWTARR
jgi:lipoate-protein ligase A